MAYLENGKWWVSPANYEDEVTGGYSFAPKIEILDTTLRDGEQQPGIIFTRDDKVEIAKKLDETGVHRIEAGTPAASQEDADAIKAICELGLDARIFAFCRAMPKDMELAKSLGVDGVLCEMIGSEQMLRYGKRWTPEQAIEACVEATRAAHELGMYVTFFPADGSRAETNYLLDFVQAVAEEGTSTPGWWTRSAPSPRRCRLHDQEAEGLLLPEGSSQRFRPGVATTIAALKEVPRWLT